MLGWYLIIAYDLHYFSCSSNYSVSPHALWMDALHAGRDHTHHSMNPLLKSQRAFLLVIQIQNWAHVGLLSLFLHGKEHGYFLIGVLRQITRKNAAVSLRNLYTLATSSPNDPSSFSKCVDYWGQDTHWFGECTDADMHLHIVFCLCLIICYCYFSWSGCLSKIWFNMKLKLLVAVIDEAGHEGLSAKLWSS